LKTVAAPYCCALSLFLSVLVSPSFLRAQSSEPQAIRLVTLLGRPLPVVVAEMHGTFTKYGITLRSENIRINCAPR
jgi:hypothetical protein